MPRPYDDASSLPIILLSSQGHSVQGQVLNLAHL